MGQEDKYIGGDNLYSLRGSGDSDSVFFVNQASHMFALLCTLNRQLYKHHLLAVDNTALCTAAVQDQAVCTQKDTGY